LIHKLTRSQMPFAKTAQSNYIGKHVDSVRGEA
jgi:hypothetical protein